MKTIIAGSRDVTELSVVASAIDRSGFAISEVVSGTARGVDRLGEQWAQQNGVPVARFPANWDRYGNGAGHIRNGEMADYADALVAVWDGESPGTAGMIRNARKKGLKVHVLNLRAENEPEVLRFDF